MIFKSHACRLVSVRRVVDLIIDEKRRAVISKLKFRGSSPGWDYTVVGSVCTNARFYVLQTAHVQIGLIYHSGFIACTNCEKVVYGTVVHSQRQLVNDLCIRVKSILPRQLHNVANGVKLLDGCVEYWLWQTSRGNCIAEICAEKIRFSAFWTQYIGMADSTMFVESFEVWFLVNRLVCVAKGSQMHSNYLDEIDSIISM